MSKLFSTFVVTALLSMPISNIIASGVNPQQYNQAKENLQSYVDQNTAMLFGDNNNLPEVRQFARNTTEKICRSYAIF